MKRLGRNAHTRHRLAAVRLVRDIFNRRTLRDDVLLTYDRGQCSVWDHGDGTGELRKRRGGSYTPYTFSWRVPSFKLLDHAFAWLREHERAEAVVRLPDRDFVGGLCVVGRAYRSPVVSETDGRDTSFFAASCAVIYLRSGQVYEPLDWEPSERLVSDCKPL